MRENVQRWNTEIRSRNGGKWMPRLERSRGECTFAASAGEPSHSPVSPHADHHRPRLEFDIFRNRSTRPTSSSGRCWRRGGSRRRGEGNIREPERPSRGQRRKLWSCESRRSNAVEYRTGLIDIFLSHSVSHVLSRLPLARHDNQRYPEPRLVQELAEVDSCSVWRLARVPSLTHLNGAAGELKKSENGELSTWPNLEQLILASRVGVMYSINTDSIGTTVLLGGRRFQPQALRVVALVEESKGVNRRLPRYPRRRRDLQADALIGLRPLVWGT